MSKKAETTEKKVKVVVISPFTDKENDYLLRTPKLNNEYETTEARALELIEKGKVKYAEKEPELNLNDPPKMVHRSTVETEDFTRIPEVISEPDVIENAGMYNKHPVVHFKKDGITIVGVIADGALDLYTQTMYISKKNRSLATAIDEQTSINTSETTRSTASNNIISDDTKNTTPKRKSSLSSGNEDVLPIRGDVYGKDISLDIPIRDEIAPVQENVVDDIPIRKDVQVQTDPIGLNDPPKMVHRSTKREF